MRRLVLLLALLPLAAACPAANNDEEGQPVPLDRFLFPTGLVHLPGSVPESEGSLVVASSNFNKRFGSGSVLAVDLAQVRSSASGRVGLPPFGEAPAGEVPVFDVLGVDPERQAVRIESFAGEMDAWTRPEDGTRRLFVPTRSEGDLLHVVDFRDGQLTCAGTEGRDCRRGALSLTADIEGASGDQPRAPSPLGVRVRDDQVWVSHVGAADSPEGSNTDLRAYLVRLDAANPEVSAQSFLPIAEPNLLQGAAHTLALGQRFAFVTGRNFGTATSNLVATDFLLLLVQREREGERAVLVPVTSLASSFPAGEGVEARGVDISPDERRVYIATRNPEALLVLDVLNPTSPTPTVTLVRYVPDVPAGPSQVRVIPRPNQGPLVAISCTGPEAAALALYDEDLGELTVVNVGDPDVARPFGLAVSPRAVGTSAGARVFVSNFGDGRVAVIDIPNLATPQGARLVAFLGLQQQTQETVSEE